MRNKERNYMTKNEIFKKGFQMYRNGTEFTPAPNRDGYTHALILKNRRGQAFISWGYPNKYTEPMALLHAM